MYYSRPARLPLQRPHADDHDEDFDYDDEEQEIVFNPIVCETKGVDTGLVDAEGNPIYRCDRVPLGFLGDLF